MSSKNGGVVLLLYRSLLSIATKYDKNIPSHRNPFFNILESRKFDIINNSLKQAVRISFKSYKGVTEEKQIRTLIDQGFDNLRMLNSLYQPCKLWANVIDKKDTPLAEGAIAIAQVADPKLDPSIINTQFDQIASRVQQVLHEITQERQKGGDPANTNSQVLDTIAALNKVIFTEMGFHGNRNNFKQPENSFIHKVLARKTGIPVTLCALYQACAQRVGLSLLPVGAPYHFLLKYQPPTGQGDETFIDVFNGGTVMTREQTTQFLEMVMKNSEIQPHHLDTIKNRVAYQRMLTNLITHDKNNNKWRDNLFVITHMSDA